MIVVAIVGILAVLGVVGYRKLVLAAHTSEATHMVQSIRTAEEAYHAEAQAYVSTVPTVAGLVVATNLFPNTAPSNVMTSWYTPTSACAAGGSVGCWAALPVHVDGAVSYGYGVTAGSAGSKMDQVTIPYWPAMGPTTPPSTDWYWVVAMGNPANLPIGGIGPFSWVVGNSLSSQLWVLDQ